MPFELGLFVGAKQFGDARQRSKNYLVLDRDRYRVGKFLSDLSGIDPKAHDNNAHLVVGAVRNWLNTSANPTKIPMPGTREVLSLLNEFQRVLPRVASKVVHDLGDLSFADYTSIIEDFLSLPRPTR